MVDFFFRCTHFGPTPHLPRQAPQAGRFVGQTGVRGLCIDLFSVPPFGRRLTSCSIDGKTEKPSASSQWSFFGGHIQHQALAGTTVDFFQKYGLPIRFFDLSGNISSLSSPLNPWILQGSPPSPCTHYTQGHLLSGQPAKPLKYLKVVSSAKEMKCTQQESPIFSALNGFGIFHGFMRKEWTWTQDRGKDTVTQLDVSTSQLMQGACLLYKKHQQTKFLFQIFWLHICGSKQEFNTRRKTAVLPTPPFSPFHPEPVPLFGRDFKSTKTGGKVSQSVVPASDWTCWTATWKAWFRWFSFSNQVIFRFQPLIVHSGNNCGPRWHHWIQKWIEKFGSKLLNPTKRNMKWLALFFLKSHTFLNLLWKGRPYLWKGQIKMHLILGI